jgi:hypothetical protein
LETFLFVLSTERRLISIRRVFSATDDHVDLLGVSLVFTQSHLWANMQPKAKPWEVRPLTPSP